jgi:hypothetical protein
MFVAMGSPRSFGLHTHTMSFQITPLAPSATTYPLTSFVFPAASHYPYPCPVSSLHTRDFLPLLPSLSTQTDLLRGL